MALDLTSLMITMCLALVLPQIAEWVVRTDNKLVQMLVPGLLASLTGALSTVMWSDFQSWEAYLAAIGTAWVVAARAHYAGMYAGARR